MRTIIIEVPEERPASIEWIFIVVILVAIAFVAGMVYTNIDPENGKSREIEQPTYIETKNY